MNPVAWTLSCEAFFYLVFPMAIRAIRRLSASGLLRAAAAVTTLGSLVVVAFLEPRGITVSTFPPFRVWEFVLGILAGTPIRAGWLRSVPPLAASCLLLFAALSASTWVSGLRGVGIALTTVAFTGIISALALGDLRARSWSPLRSQVARMGGEWSYAFYLVQLYPLALLFGWGWSARNWWETSVVMTGWFVVTVAGAAALHRLVENPAVVALRPPGQVRVPAS